MNLVKGIFPKDPKLIVVAEAPGAQEVHKGLPLVGPSGQLFDKMLAAAGLKREECVLTNVFEERPPNNDVSAFFLGKREQKELAASEWPALAGKFIRPDKAPALERLRSELSPYRGIPIIALGNTAVWALCRKEKITKLRGTFLESTLLPGAMVLPTYHPAAVLRDYSLRPIVVGDIEHAIQKNKPRPRRVYVPEDQGDIKKAFQAISGASAICLDIETTQSQIDTVGIATSAEEAWVFPLWHRDVEGLSYFSLETELLFWAYLSILLASPRKLVLHNATYDLTYLMEYGIEIKCEIHDTMLMHHSLQPEMKKDLGLLATMYVPGETAWKLQRQRTKSSLKAGDQE